MNIFLKLFLTFLKIGAFTFGGGYAMLPLIQKEVLENGWMENEALINFIAVSESTPGPFAINMATFVGTKMGGVLGAFLATLGVVLPSFVIILILAKGYEKFKEHTIVKGLMSGLKPAVVGLILSAVVSVFMTIFFSEGLPKEKLDIIRLVISAATFGLSFFLIMKKKHPILIVVISAVIGILTGYIFGL